MPLEAIQPGATALTVTPACAPLRTPLSLGESCPWPARASAASGPWPGMPPHVAEHIDDTPPVCSMLLIEHLAGDAQKPPTRLVAYHVSKTLLIDRRSGAGNWPPDY